MITISKWFTNGDTPLHTACKNKNVGADIVKALLDFWPESASIKNQFRFGEYPIHALCMNRGLQDADSFEILKLLAEASPLSLQNEDEYGFLPIHHAAESKPRDFCKILVEAYPESVRIASDRALLEGLPIHHACKGGCLDTVKYLLDLDPESIRARDNDGNLPIQYAAYYCSDNNENADIFRLLLDQDPTLASMANDGGQSLPLHLGCMSKHVNLEAIKLLFDSFPEALLTKNRYGFTPLDLMRRLVNDSNHSAAMSFLETQLAYARQTRNSDIMTTPDSKGWLPLHRALRAKVSLGSIKLMVNGNHNAVRVAGTSCGSFPLHIACEFCTVDVVEFLAESYDGSLNLHDNNGNSPLHRACLAGDCSVVRYLLEGHGKSVSTYNADKKLPIHLLIESDLDRKSLEYQEAIFLLIQAYPETIENF